MRRRMLWSAVAVVTLLVNVTVKADYCGSLLADGQYTLWFLDETPDGRGTAVTVSEMTTKDRVDVVTTHTVAGGQGWQFAYAVPHKGVKRVTVTIDTPDEYSIATEFRVLDGSGGIVRDYQTALQKDYVFDVTPLP